MVAIHQILPGLRYGDAISTQALAIQDRLREWDYSSDIYASLDSTDPVMQRHCRPYTEYTSRPGQVVIYHHAIGSDLAAWVRGLPDHVILYYHNITPAEYAEVFHPRLARGLAMGRDQLAFFSQRPYALAGSEYNRRELSALGYACVDILPYFIPFASLDEGLGTVAGQAVLKRYDNGGTNWLFVGRLVPNKCQTDLVRMFAYYQHWIDPDARLLLVGSNADTPGYRSEMERLIGRLQVRNVELCGSVPQNALGAYYHVASGYVSMSEHEGFGIPLLEAMHMEVPVVAYAAAAVPDTLGSAGILVHRKRFEVVAEMLNLLASDAPLCKRVVAWQRQRVAEFAPEQVAAQLRNVVKQALDF
jgi:L-malate glycosyltransferase